MPYIQLGIHLKGKTDEGYGIKSVAINFNDTDIPSDSSLVQTLAMALLKAIHINKDDIIVQDLLNELDIKRES